MIRIRKPVQVQDEDEDETETEYETAAQSNPYFQHNVPTNKAAATARLED